MDHDPGAGRKPLHGTREQVLEDLTALRGKGVTEVFLDLNYSARVNDTHVTGPEAIAYAERVLDAMAPA